MDSDRKIWDESLAVISNPHKTAQLVLDLRGNLIQNFPVDCIGVKQHVESGDGKMTCVFMTAHSRDLTFKSNFLRQLKTFLMEEYNLLRILRLW